MEITLSRATIDNAQELHAMQVESFKELLEKYQDFDTNPGNESMEKVAARLKQVHGYLRNHEILRYHMALGQYLQSSL